MNKRRKHIIWITCLLAVLTLGVTSANISKADKTNNRKIVDNISNELENNKNADNINDNKSDDVENNDNEISKDENLINKENTLDDKDNNSDTKEDAIVTDNEKDLNEENKDKKEKEDDVVNDKNKDDVELKEDKEVDSSKIEDEELLEKDTYSSSKKDKDYINSNKTAYEIFMGNGLHVVGKVYTEDNKPLSFDGSWFALEDTQYVYAIEESKEEDVTLYKAYVLINNKESYIYFKVDEGKHIEVLGYKQESKDSISTNRYGQDEDYTAITSDMKVTPIYKYVNKDTGEDGKRYGSETSVGEKIIVVKKLRKWSSAQM